MLTMKSTTQYETIDAIEALVKRSKHFRKSGFDNTFCEEPFESDPRVLKEAGLRDYGDIVHGAEADYEAFLVERGNGADCFNPLTQKYGTDFLEKYRPTFHPDAERRLGKESLN